MIKIILNFFLKIFFGLKEIKSREIGKPRTILIVRQHNQLGDLLASTPIFTALKESFPDSEITAIVSRQNFKAYQNNPLIKKLFIFEKSKIFNKEYFCEFKNIIMKRYDLAVVPSVTSISFTSNFLARISNSEIRIGVKYLNGKLNQSNYLFDRLVNLDWRVNENTHISLRNLAILEPFGITTVNLKTIIHSAKSDFDSAQEFIKSIPGNNGVPIIGLHVGAGKIPNRWSFIKFGELIARLVKHYDAKIYFSGGSKDDEELISAINKNLSADYIIFKKPGMAVLKEVIEQSDLFITNDTGPMHAAAATDIAVISLFGQTNPFIWAPLGKNKVFIQKGNDIDNISVDDVYYAATQLLSFRK